MLSMKRIGFINLEVESLEICVFHLSRSFTRRGTCNISARKVRSSVVASNDSNSECCFIKTCKALAYSRPETIAKEQVLAVVELVGMEPAF
jgi:hypothetical protein